MADQSAAALASLQQTQANIAARMAEITASQNPTYTVGNRTVSKTEYLTALVADLDAVTKSIQLLGGPYIVRSRGSI